ncbi:MAG: CCA tRNA nucleotidyltransferase [Deltaproteobacteria bacterium]|nr:CCA tRNA nucleotidyltransferase [Deltaproteobacteria bacterium]
MILPKNQSALIEEIYSISKSNSVELFLVGGFLRDSLLDIESLDYDFVVEGDAIKFAETLKAEIGGELKSFASFGTAKLVNFNFESSIYELDFAMAREESYAHPGALPTVVSGKLESDLQRRDFTINSMAIALRDIVESLNAELTLKELIRAKLLDPFGGLLDLDQKLIRILHDLSFQDDPTRIFRAYRYLVRIGGELEQHTAKLLQTALKDCALQNISVFRIYNEFKKIALEQNPSRVFAELLKHGVLAGCGWFSKKSGEKFCQAVELSNNLSEDLPLILLASIDQVKAEAALKEMRFKSKEISAFKNQITQSSDSVLISFLNECK